MDHHKNSTGTINSPPPAHNMSGPPHAIPPGHPMPAHSGSSASITRPPVTPSIIAKQPYFDNPLKSQTLNQDKSAIAPISVKPPIPSSPNEINQAKLMGLSNDPNNEKKSLYSAPGMQYHHGNSNHQIHTVHQVGSMVAPQQQSPSVQAPSHLQQQSSSPLNEQGNNLSGKLPSSNQQNITDKQESNKNSAPPVPGLISIKHPLTSPQLSPKVTHTEDKTIQNSKNNSVHKGASNGNVHASDFETSVKSCDPSKVSILPSKPSAQKCDAIKPQGSTNTVTITPSPKTPDTVTSITENDKKVKDNIEPSQNGINGKVATKAPVVASANVNKEIKHLNAPHSNISVAHTTSSAESQLNSKLSVHSVTSITQSSEVAKTPSAIATTKSVCDSSSVSPQNGNENSRNKSSPVSSSLPLKSQVNSLAKSSPQKLVKPNQLPKNQTSSIENKDDKTINKKSLNDNDAKMEKETLPLGCKTGKSSLNVEEAAKKSPQKVVKDENVNMQDTTRGSRMSKRKVSITSTPEDGERRSKRTRQPASIYQSPIADVHVRVQKTAKSSPAPERLVVFFKNEHAALRNAEGTFYICQIAQNVYKGSRKIKIRWLSPTDETDTKCDTFKPDYYDVSDFDCILSSVDMDKVEKGLYRLPEDERVRVNNILQRAMDRDKGIAQQESELREDHPDGLDLSLYNDESQLKGQKKRKASRRRRSKNEVDSESESSDDDQDNDVDDSSDGHDEIEKTPIAKSDSRKRGSRTPATKDSPSADETASSTLRPSVGKRRRVVRNFSSPRTTTDDQQSQNKTKTPQPAKEDPPPKKALVANMRSTRSGGGDKSTSASPVNRPSPKTTRRTRCK